MKKVKIKKENMPLLAEFILFLFEERIDPNLAPLDNTVLSTPFQTFSLNQ